MCWCTHKHVRPHTVTTQSHSAPCRPLLSSWSFIKRGFRQNKWDWEWGSSGEGGIAFLIKRGEKRKGARCHRLSAFEEKNIYLIHRIPLLLVSPSLSWLSYCVQRRTRAHSHCRALRLVFIVKCNMSIVTFLGHKNHAKLYNITYSCAPAKLATCVSLSLPWRTRTL